jgi:hypothetical protein
MLFDHMRRPLWEVVVNVSPQGSFGVETTRFWCSDRRCFGRVCSVGVRRRCRRRRGEKGLLGGRVLVSLVSVVCRGSSRF